MRKAAFDELHRSLQCDRRFGGEQQMNVIGHDDEFVELKDPALTIG